MMDLPTLVAQWVADNNPDIKIERGVLCLPIKSGHTDPEYDVWYVCRVDEDRIHLFTPANNKFGPHVMAGLPTFFEQLNAVIEYYRSYTP